MSTNTTSVSPSSTITTTTTTTHHGAGGGARHGGRSISSSSSSSQPTQACAACKHQRRKCQPDCILAPYFPADAQGQFFNAHKLFGVSNILKIIKDMDPVKRAEAMATIIFQSNARAADPVGGCYRLIFDLTRHLEHQQAELALVYRQLAICKAQIQQQSPQPVDVLDPGDPAAAIYSTDEFIPMQPQQQPQQQHYGYFYFDGVGDNTTYSNENSINNNNNNSGSNSNVSVDNNNGNTSNNNGGELPAMGVSMLSLQAQQFGGGDVDDVKPIIDMFDVKAPFSIGDDDDESGNIVGAFDCTSALVELKEEPNRIEDVQEHDLKGAASLFTLTNCRSSSI